MNIIPSVGIMKDLEGYKQLVKMLMDNNITQIRCNVSTLPKESYIDCINTIQDIYSQTTGMKFEVILDVPCPKDKCRIEFSGDSKEIEISKNQNICISIIKHFQCYEDVATFYVDADLTPLSKKDVLIVGNGDLQFEVNKCGEGYLLCTSLNSGILGYRKGIATQKGLIRKSDDKKIIKAIDIIRELKPYCIALSYIENKEDVICFKRQIEGISDYEPKIMSKVESQSGVDNLEEIIKYSDSIMIPRGCLALNVGISRLLYTQDLIQGKCKENKIDTYIAAGMLSSLNTKDFPSRSDICDVAHIVKIGIENIILNGSLCKNEKFNTAVYYLNQLFELHG